MCKDVCLGWGSNLESKSVNYTTLIKLMQNAQCYTMTFEMFNVSFFIIICFVLFFHFTDIFFFFNCQQTAYLTDPSKEMQTWTG